ncbi:MAG: glycosyltransferase family 39 protein, partial [Candidatus Eiseniibacteriota bacterium]
MPPPAKGGGARRGRAKKPTLTVVRGGEAPRSGAAPRPGGSSRWTRWIAYALLGLFACYWGSKVFTEHRIGNYAVETDFYWKYGPAARDLLHGKIDISNYDSKGWGYPVAVALISATGLEPFRAAQVLALLAAVLAGLFAYRIHRSLLGPAVALCALLLLLSNETFLANTYEVGTDMFFFAIVLGCVSLLLGRTRPDTWALLGSGLLGGWAFSTRYNGLFLWPGACLLLLGLRTIDGNARVRLRSAAIWSGGFVAAALPWLVVNAVHT